MKLKIFKIIIVIIIVFLIFLALNKFFCQTLKNTVFLISEPVQKLFWQEQNIFSQWLKNLFQSKNLKRNYEELKKENLFLKSEILRLKDEELENKELRKVLDLDLKKEFKLILADVISKKIGQDSILINRGSKDGVSEDMTAITSDKVLIGKVEEVLDDFSQVKLISEKNFTFSVEVETDEGPVLGACNGYGNFKVKIELLPKEAQIRKGDIISTSLLGGIFPKNLLVGKIETIKKNDTEPFQEGKITPFFEELNFEKLFLIK